MKRQKARVINPDGTERFDYPSDGKKFTLQELQAMVGGYIEHVILPRGNGHVQAFVNEEGKLTGLPYNEVASKIYGREPADVIVGTMVIVSTEDVGPDPTRYADHIKYGAGWKEPVKL